MNLKRIAIGTAGIIIGNLIAERFVLKASASEPGFGVVVSEGLGMDEIARALLGIASTAVIEKVVRGVL